MRIYFVATLLTLFYLGCTIALYVLFVKQGAATEDVRWTRAVFLFGGVSSIGFTAVGILLGTKVQQVNVADAKKDAADAKKDTKVQVDANNDALQALNTVSDAEGGGATASLDVLKPAHSAMLAQVKSAKRILQRATGQVA